MEGARRSTVLRWIVSAQHRRCGVHREALKISEWSGEARSGPASDRETTPGLVRLAHARGLRVAEGEPDIRGCTT